MDYPQMPIIPAFFHRISLQKKFLLMCLLALLSMSLSLYYIYMTKKFSSRFLYHEIKNLSYNREMAELLQSLYKHQVLVHRIYHGESSLKETLTNLQDQINRHFENLKSSPSQPQNIIQYSQNVNLPQDTNWISALGLEEDWKYLQKNALDLPIAKSDAHHEQLVQEIRSFLAYLDESHQSPTEENSTNHYFINHVMQQLPGAQENLVKILINGENAIHDGKLKGEDRQGLLIALESLKANLLSSQAYRQNAKNHETSMTEFRESLRKYFAAVEEFILFTENTLVNSPDITPKADQFASLGDRALTKSFELWSASAKQLEDTLQKHFKHFINSQNFTILIIILSTCLLLLLCWLTWLEIMQCLQEIKSKVSLWLHSQNTPLITDKMPAEFKSLADNLNEIASFSSSNLAKLKQAGVHFATSSTRISEASENQKKILQQQNLASKDIGETVLNLSLSAKEFSNVIHEIGSRTEQAESLMQASREIVGGMEQKIRQLIEVSNQLSSKLVVLTEKASHISNMISAISKIADQTNLLSLNAAIEAEKAGEHGRSFSVIAREIRRLADQTTNTTSDIEKMINEIVSTVSAGVMSIDKFSQEIHTGVSQTTNLNELLAKILENAHSQQNIIQKVEEEINHQAFNSDQIHNFIHKLETSTQQTETAISQFMHDVQDLVKSTQEMRENFSQEIFSPKEYL